MLMIFDQDPTLESIRGLPTNDNLVESEQPDPDPVVENPDGTLTDQPKTHKVGVSDASIDQLQRSPERVELRIEEAIEVEPLLIALLFPLSSIPCLCFRMLLRRQLIPKTLLMIPNKRLVINHYHQLLRSLNQNLLKIRLLKCRQLLLQR
jgi:hypothetical protein